jgi:cytosine/adenosine deaminase-related metal-dependent hydrolase
VITSLPGLVNAHMHSPYGPWTRGITRSRPFELWMADIMAREDNPLSAEEVEACALLSGLENLAVGNTALIDQHFGPQSLDGIHAAARAYETLGLRAWVFVTLSDLPYICFTREAYARYPMPSPSARCPRICSRSKRPRCTMRSSFTAPHRLSVPGMERGSRWG